MSTRPHIVRRPLKALPKIGPHDFAVRVNGAVASIYGRPAIELNESDAWALFIAHKGDGRVELLRGAKPVAMIGRAV